MVYEDQVIPSFLAEHQQAMDGYLWGSGREGPNSLGTVACFPKAEMPRLGSSGEIPRGLLNSVLLAVHTRGTDA